MGNKLSGFAPVYRYTLKSQMTSKKFIIITILFAVLLMGGISTIFVFAFKPDEEAVDFNIKKVYVADETGLGVPDYKAYGQALSDENLPKVEFVEISDVDKTIEENNENSELVIVVQKEEEDSYLLYMISSDNSTIDSKVVDMLGESMKMAFQYHVYNESGLDEAALTNALIKVDTSVFKFNSDEDEMKDIIEVILFMGLLMIIYIVTLMYGQQICAEVSIEKNSKLVEQLLVSVTPYGLVSGKVFAVITASIIQFFIWIIAVIAGIFGGDKMAQMFYSNYDSKVDTTLNLVKSLFGGMAFEAKSVVLAIIIMILALVFYLVLAGFAGSMVTKPEDAAAVQGYYTFPIIISFFVVLMQLVNGEGTVSVVLHFIPFTSAMVTPAAVLLGSIPFWMGLVSAAFLFLGAIALMFLAARIYKGLLFFSGNKVTPKVVWGVIKGNKNRK